MADLTAWGPFRSSTEQIKYMKLRKEYEERLAEVKSSGSISQDATKIRESLIKLVGKFRDECFKVYDNEFVKEIEKLVNYEPPPFDAENEEVQPVGHHVIIPPYQHPTEYLGQHPNAKRISKRSADHEIVKRDVITSFTRALVDKARGLMVDLAGKIFAAVTGNVASNVVTAVFDYFNPASNFNRIKALESTVKDFQENFKLVSDNQITKLTEMIAHKKILDESALRITTLELLTEETPTLAWLSALVANKIMQTKGLIEDIKNDYEEREADTHALSKLLNYPELKHIAR